MTAYGPSHWGVDIAAFWEAMTAALAEFLREPPPVAPVLRAELLPVIVICPSE